MSDLANWLRVIAKEMAAHDEPPSWHHPIVEAADEIEKLQAALNTFVAAVPKDCVLVSRVATEQMGARIVAFETENKKLRAAIEMALECIEDVDVIGARQTLAKALGEKE